MSSLVVNTNVQALNSHRSLRVTAEVASKSSEKLSSGLRINRAGDDAAGLAISEKMRNQIKGLNQASRNAQDGISLIQTAEGALQEVHEMLKRMRELVVQAANDTNVASDRQKIGLELNQLVEEINATADKTEFNTRKLINGALNTNGLFLQVGANTGQNLTFTIASMKCSALGLTNSYAMSKFTATALVNSTLKGSAIMNLAKGLDIAIGKVSTQRAELGARQNRLEHTIKNLDVASENLSASESRIRDTDMAMEMMNFTKGNVLQQAGIAMLAQANNAPNNVLSLIR